MQIAAKDLFNDFFFLSQMSRAQAALKEQVRLPSETAIGC